MTKPKIAVAYMSWPHYRSGIGTAMQSSLRYSYHMLGALDNFAPSIPMWEGWREGEHTVAPLLELPWGWWQKEIVPLAFDRSVKAIILLPLPHSLSHWACIMLSFLTRKPVLIWTHGWTRHDSLRVKLAKRILYSLPRALLLYSERGATLGTAAGFPASKLVPIGNTLDYPAQRALLDSISVDESKHTVASTVGTHPYVICTTRLIAECRLELLCEALAILRAEGTNLTALLVGEGPERSKLESLFDAADIPVHFAGAVYDERRLASWIRNAEMTVSPGKVGLTAMHSLTYGTPVISHNDFVRQMPEVEAIIPGTSGELFEYGSAVDLARAMRRQLNANQLSRSQVAKRCIQTIEENYTPDIQLSKIEKALDEILK